MGKRRKHRGDDKVRTRDMDVSPAFAEKILVGTDEAVTAGKIPQRKRSLAKVARITRAITEGRWRANGQSISLSPEKWALNGQHRLAAIVESGVTIRIPVAFNVPKDTFATIDHQSNRSAADVIDAELGRDGARSSTLSSALRLLYRYNAKSLRANDRKHTSIDSDEILALLRRNIAIRDCFAMADRAAGDKVLSVAVALFCYYVFLQHNVSAAETFMSSLADGVGLKRGSPILVLRRRLLRRHGSKVGMRGEEMAALTFKAWVLFVAEGKATKTFVWRKDEDFPYLNNTFDFYGKTE